MGMNCTHASGCTIIIMKSLFTPPQRSWSKVIFLHLSVILFTGGVGDPQGRHPPADTTPLGRHPPGRHPPEQTPPCTVHAGIRSTSGRYASYWNAILLNLDLTLNTESDRSPLIFTKTTFLGYRVTFSYCCRSVCLLILIYFHLCQL